MVMQSFSDSKIQSWLTWFLRGLLILGFFIILGRLIELQIVKGDYFRGLAEGNRIRRVPITAPRGKIYARGGEVLVGNREVKKLVVFDPVEGYKKLEEFENAGEEDLISEWERNYQLGETAAHITGYLGEVTEKEVGKIDPRCLEKGPRKLGSLVGRTGLEEEYECLLSGIDGEELVEVDSLGNRIRTLGRKEPIVGNDLKTTIDYDLQMKVAEIINENEEIPFEKKAAVIITDTQGEVLALYSSPSYNPNYFVTNNNSKITKILNDKNLPLFNRVIAGRFHPGSVFKPIIATAALEEGVIDEQFLYEDTGQIVIETLYGTFKYTNWYFTQYGGTEGEINITHAIKRSTDTFFYKVGELLGIEKINQWSEKFGLKNETGIDIPGEVVSLVPSPEWKELVRGERWFLGNTYHVSIGQGDIALTPIGLNNAISAVASEGRLCKPTLVKNVECVEINLGDKSINLVKEGMRQACREGGTGYTFFDFGVSMACKTGTAETEEEDKTHAWFVAFAPVDFPEIVTTVMVEKGGEGSRIAGPITRAIFDYWFTN